MRQSPLFSADRCSFPSAPVMLRLSNDVECESGGETVPHQPIYKHNKKSQEAAHGSCGWAQPVSQQPLLTCVWQEVSAKWLCNICPQDCHLLWAWLPGSLSALSWYFNQSKCWLIEVQTETVWVNLSFNKKMSGHDSWMSMRYFPVCGMSLKDQKMYCPICLNYEEVIKGRSWIGQAVLTLESLLHLKMQKSSSIKSIIIYFYYTFIPFNCIIFFYTGQNYILFSHLPAQYSVILLKSVLLCPLHCRCPAGNLRKVKMTGFNLNWGDFYAFLHPRL